MPKHDLTYDDLLKLHKMLSEEPLSRPMTPKEVLFMMYFPRIENIDDYIVIASDTIYDIKTYAKKWDWLYIDKNVEKDKMFAVKKDKLYEF